MWYETAEPPHESDFVAFAYRGLKLRKRVISEKDFPDLMRNTKWTTTSPPLRIQLNKRVGKEGMISLSMLLLLFPLILDLLETGQGDQLQSAKHILT